MSLHAGEMLGILGANGAGKSTLLSALAGELHIDTGLHRHCPIMVNGRGIVTFTPEELARVRAVLPQHATLTFDLRVREVISMGLYPYPELSLCDSDDALASVMQQTGTERLAGRRYLTLSGGERQRVQFARTLLQVVIAMRHGLEGRFLMLDEPSSSLDPAHQHALLQTARVTADRGAGVLVVLHDINLAARYCHRLLLLNDGRVVASGQPREVLRPDILQEVYGAPAHVLPHPVHPQLPLVIFL